jgi:hypothetical protein
LINKGYVDDLPRSNQHKRFVTLKFNENYEDVIDKDECSVIIRLAGYTNYRKDSSDILRAFGGKIGKPKHSTVKIHLLGGVSRKGLTPLVLFKDNMNSVNFKHYMSLSVLPFIRQKMPYRHRLIFYHSKLIAN